MKVINGNNIELLKQYPDNYFDAIVTDPPYGLGKEPDCAEMLKAWLEVGYMEVKGSGFMGKEWDAFVPQPIFWKEVFRVLKHGGHVLAFYGTRTYDWGVMAMRLAGFEVRDCIQWLYGCLSDDTEVLTRSGYIQYHKFKMLPNFEEQEILIYDIENDIYKWEKPERWNEYNINKDTCYRIESDRTEQIVSRNHRCLVERKGKLVFIQAEDLAEMEYMPTLSDDFHILQESEVLQSSMQRTLSGSGMEETRTQGEESMVGKNERELSVISNGRKESLLERGNYIPKKKGVLFGSEIEICEMSERVYSDGEERWVCSGISADYGNSDRQTFIENGVRTSYRPQSNEQRHQQFDAFFNEQGTQKIRMGRSYSTTLATITPIEYSGVIFCPTVSTGCFVARRKGKIFITGNSGFPKSHNISKAIDKINGNKVEVIGKNVTDGFLGSKKSRCLKCDKPFFSANPCKCPKQKYDNEWDGWGSALKPANEPIVLARKPLEKGLSIAENVLKHSTGGLNINGCRVGLNGSENLEATQKNFDSMSYHGAENTEGVQTYNSQGRFPANLILTHHPECECVGTKKVGSGKDGGYNYNGNVYEVEGFVPKNSPNANSNYGQEEVEDWNCHPDCPIKILDEQSIDMGMHSAGVKRNKEVTSEYENTSFHAPTTRQMNRFGDKGGASRFFYVAKASKSERNKGLDAFEEKVTSTRKGDDNSIVTRQNLIKNFHPTVKPIKLMQYLVRLITPPNGIVLDPFCGSGTTGIACKLEGFDFVGMEQDPEYTKIAVARINNYFEGKEEKPQKIPETQEADKKSKYIQPDLFS